MTQNSGQAPRVLDIAIGLHTSGTREESDSLGAVRVPADHYWGAQTQRSLQHFDIGGDKDRMPIEVYRAYGIVKKAAARINTAAGSLPAWMGSLIGTVADEVVSGQLDSEFPLFVWQTGSGTQSNMNVNEVISNRCIQLVGGELGTKRPVHPNDHVNMSQSSNDTFPTAMHIAADTMLHQHVLPQLDDLQKALSDKSRQWNDVVKIGRTHLEDATPLTVGQEWSGYAAMVQDARDALVADSSGLPRLAVGGTAVGTGLNTAQGFDGRMAEAIADLTGRPFVTAPNKFAAQGSLDALVRCSGGLRNLAVTLFKIANDLRWLGSGPRAGLHELVLPSNEPGSSIMPGKVNPTQAEAMLMVAIQVIGNDTTVAVAGKEGNFELNAFRPIILANLLHSMRIMGDMCNHFRRFMIEGTTLDKRRIKEYVDSSVMMVTALSPVIGYDKASAIAHKAMDEDLTLRQAAIACGIDAEEFDRVVVPLAMTRPGPQAH
ncbi:class II fumarate hydratase [Streptomyces castrisilvae]|uniref:Fumarate hydratase class II n=1 Tax=Streptomyces castrisilvae TaxID=3033811 RepID=A0ABY9HGX8_9ACTN|nr:class II fumarate hydratase [Streptomyces sp. Mut1]WLQ33434.1 class II fumarate hydratase [Streptomyces sp. Mut1]